MYRKLKASEIFTGYEMLPGSHVLITDDTGVIIDMVDIATAGDDIEEMDGILSPGFINCHCHLELSHMKGLIPKHTGLVDFVLKVVTERHFEEAEILAAIEAAEKAMLQQGIVAVGDICNNTLTIPQKSKAFLHYHNFIEASGFPPAVADMRFKRAVGFYNAYSEILPANSIVPHAPYSVSPEMFAMINDFPNNKILTIHNQEIPAENELFKTGTGGFLRMYEKMGIDISFFKPSGKTSLQTYLPQLAKAEKLILVHNVDTSQADLDFITRNLQPSTPNLFFCLCPNANLYISNKLPDVNLFISNDRDIVVGTDSLASNNQLSIAAEIKTLKENFPAISNEMFLKWATVNGARALGIENVYGSFEKNKKPGVVLVDKNFLEAKKII